MSRSLLRHLLHGALGFALVSIAAFAVWAFGGPWFRGRGGEPAMYAAITAVFLGLSGAVLAPLAGGWGRFYRAFLPAFGVYALVWSLAWFSLHGRTGEWVGALAGCLAFSSLCLRRLGGRHGLLLPALAFFAWHTAGYFAGSWAMYGFWLDPARLEEFPGLGKADVAVLAKLSWGLCYGLGFGAGLGQLLHRARVGA